MVYKRTEKEIFDTILNVANEHDFVRAVILNGSKADKNCLKDDYQDFDIWRTFIGIIQAIIFQ